MRAFTKSSQVEPEQDKNPPWLRIIGARQNNLRDVTAEIPLQRFVCVTGVSGSGKSSLVNDTLREVLARDLNGVTKAQPGDHDNIDGLEHLDKVIDIDQSPIGRTPRSNPATYIKVFDEIRKLYSMLPDAKVRGYKPGRFSFNVHSGSAGGGRCESCEGNGANKMEMDFLADVWVTCPVCDGHRFSRETLQVRYKGMNIADVLEMDVQQALEHFENVPKVERMLRTLHDVGLDYVKLGQSSTTLSGGEAQRIKLARELVKRSTGRTLYLLDEPTTGLHFDDIKKLLAVLHGFVDASNSVVVIEHNLDVVKTADWVIDLGPEGGAGGGRIVATGSPEEIAKSKTSYTGRFLREVLLAKSKSSQPRTKKNSSRASNGRKSRSISVVGAAQHNLKNVTVDIPRHKMTVCSGPSGSGKSSFAIDTVYAEGQRRYVESLSAYARQFLSRIQPPRVEHVSGLSPAICIEQKTTSKSPRSTVGTITEIYDYMRILWARLGQPTCPKCKVDIGTQSSEEIVDKVLAIGEGVKILLLAPIEPTGQESYDSFLARQKANGYQRIRIDGEVCLLADSIDIDRKRKHQIELVVDRAVVRKAQRSRITDSVEQSLSVGNGLLIVQVVDDEKKRPSRPRSKSQSTSHLAGNDIRFSQHHACDQCGTSYEELTPHHFSFNSPLGWCEACEGLGVQQGASQSAIVVHPMLSVAEGAIGAWGELENNSTLHKVVSSLAGHVGLDLYTPWNKLAEPQRLSILHGCGDDWISVRNSRGRKKNSEKRSRVDDLRFQWHGFFPAIGRATRSSWQYRKRLEDLVTDVACDVCAGGRLRPDAAAVRLSGESLRDACSWPLNETLRWFDQLKLNARDRGVAGELLHEITSRLRFLVDVGLHYVTLHRSAATLSGGESQRIQLASQIGTGLTGVLYVLDEPTIGLHPRDNVRLIQALTRLRDLGNTLMLVEHDREVIDAADHVLDFGPGAGSYGGQVTAQADPKRLRTKRASLTGRYLAGKETIPVPSNRRFVPEPPELDRVHFDADTPISTTPKQSKSKDVRWLVVHGARENNLQEIDVPFPLGRFTCVTGVSGSGKSTLVSTILHRALAARIHRARLVAGGHDRISGVEFIDKVINVDQSPIGNSPTSNPATYTGLFDAVRQLFAQLPLSKIRGYTANRFSFNRTGGRCEACQGMGQQCIEMHFLPDVWVECENCKGSRYVPETLAVRYKERSIADVLSMQVSDACELFENVPKVYRMLQTLDDVGLGYLALGQSAPTLSGGEAQRVKLAAELGKPSTGKTLYILDEPTTGLHFDDLKKLLGVLHRLVDLGNTCICIEHNLDVIKTADWVIDLGPEASDGGGRVVIAGPPEVVARSKASRTGRALKPVLIDGPLERRESYDPPKERTRVSQKDKTTDLGADVQMPWERNGESWHMVSPVDHKGEPVQWHTDVLRWLVDTTQSMGNFAPTDWSHRTMIEIKAPGSPYWFCHFRTGGKDLLEIALRVPEKTYKADALQRRLQVKTLDERRDLPVYGQWSRVRVGSAVHDWQEVRMFLRDEKDVKKATFRAFLKSAVAAYFEQVEKVREEPKTSKPWLEQGLTWHLSQASINSRHKKQWKPAVLMALIGRFKAMDRNLDFDWASKTAGRMILPGEKAWLGKLVTNMGRGVRVELRAPKNVVTPAQVDRLGDDVDIKSSAGFDRVVFWVRSVTQTDTKQLSALWHLSRSDVLKERLQSA